VSKPRLAGNVPPPPQKKKLDTEIIGEEAWGVINPERLAEINNLFKFEM